MQLQQINCFRPNSNLGGAEQQLPLAVIYVYVSGTQTLATIYDKAANALSNPFNADANGIAKFRAPNGLYDIQVNGPDPQDPYSAPLLEEVPFSDNLNNVSFNTAQITGGDPSGDNGVATKGYVDKRAGAFIDKGTWNANTNSPTLVSSTGTKGWHYRVSVAGTTALDGVSAWAANDIVYFDGNVWQRIGYGYAPENAANKSTATDLGGGSPSNTLFPTQAAVKTYADQLIAAADAMVFKGVIDCSANPNYPAADAGHQYRVSVAGKIGGASGTNVEAGDILLCLDDGTSSGTQAAQGSHWSVIQTNIDGAVVGPASAVDGHIPKFSGTSGKLLADGYQLDTDGTLAGNSDTSIPSEKAVKTYADTKIARSGDQMTGALDFKAAVSVAAAATCNIGAATSNLVTITGTTGITAFDNVAAGILRICTIQDGCLFTNNATSLILPGVQDIISYPGDVLCFVSLGSGNWRLLWHMLAYQKPPAKNLIYNGDFAVWQSGTSFALAGSTKTFIADLWVAYRPTNTGFTFSQQPGFNGATYCLRAQRTAGNTSVNAVRWGFQIGSSLATQLQGKNICVSCDIRAGANWGKTDPTAINCQLFYGTGTDEAFDLGAINFATGPGSVFGSIKGISTTAARLYAIVGASANTPFPVPSTATELFILFTYSPTGTAGAADYVELTNLKLEVGSTPTKYEPTPLFETLEACRRQFRKSFAQGTTPAQSIGTGTGEYRFPALRAGALVEWMGTVLHGSPMRTIPTVTLYNPAAANAQVRDLTAAADCSASAAGNVSDLGFEITATGNASTAVGNDLACHWTADARL